MYEQRRTRPLTRQKFLIRVANHFALAAGLLLGSLLGGMAGYMFFESLAWRDAFLNAAMLLGGMGPVDGPKTNGGKLFAGSYALYAGFVVLIVAAVLLAPVVHRLMHRFHWEKDDKGSV
jgi:sterol desaturase/sphingolipid hydroxylase (fatty acid hydroxylase superfamily)